MMLADPLALKANKYQIGQKPRSYQLPIWQYMFRGGFDYKRAMLVMHRRAGKDETCLAILFAIAMLKPAAYWYAAPSNSQARKIIWNAVDPHTGRRRLYNIIPKQLIKSENSTQMMITLINGSVIIILGIDNYDSYVGDSPYGVVVSEMALADPNFYGYISPMLLENKGFFIGNSTPRGKNFFYKRLQAALKDPRWFADIVPASKTNVFTKEQLAQELDEYIQNYGPDDGKGLFMQEYMCSFDAKITGAVYAIQIGRLEAMGRIRYDFSVYDPNNLVYTAWDLGFDDATAIWFYQKIAGEIRFVDYYESSGQELTHYAAILKEKAQKRGFKYADYHNAPHDANNKTLSSGGLSIAQQFKKLGVSLRVFKAVPQQQQIVSTREMLRRAWFCGNYCEKGIEHLKSYRFERDAKLKIYRPKPLHDEHSHAPDAIEIVSQEYKEPTDSNDNFEDWIL